VGSETDDWDGEVALPELIELDDGTFIRHSQELARSCPFIPEPEHPPLEANR
jgi:hypothetical protein